jgi:acetolactate synthase I/II/III large subunit
MQKVVTAGQAIVECLIRHGVDRIFGIPGVHTYHLFDALYERRAEITFTGTRHEQGAAYMAFGYAKSTGKIGAYTCVPGPGLLNTAAALCSAYSANAPVLCLTSEIPAGDIGRGYGILHELPDQLALLRGLTKWAERIDHPGDVPRLFAAAIEQLRTGRVGPVALECPWDTLSVKALVDFDVTAAHASQAPPDPRSVDAACRIIDAARSPMIILGAGALEAGPEILALAHRIQAPVTSHRSGRGIVSEELPYGFGFAAAHKLWLTSDVVIAIGTRLELAYLRWRHFPAGMKIVRIDIDPREFARRAADVAIVADAKLAVRAILDALPAAPLRRVQREAEFVNVKHESRHDIDVVQPQMAYLDVIRAVLPRDGFFVEEICQVGFTARFGFPVYEPRTYVTCGYQENLGFGFMTALGVKVANPDKVVISITGDGGFMFGVQELATAVQNNINLITIVFNNRSFGNVLRDQQTAFGGRLIGEALVNPNFVALAESFGAVGYRAESPEELKLVLEQALTQNAPVLIEVPSEPGSETSPWPFIRPSVP